MISLVRVSIGGGGESSGHFGGGIGSGGGENWPLASVDGRDGGRYG